ncbi:hypothetical protein STIV2_D87 [Sulfolobus turreted icosahedral virus 2]|uniref:Uncharacterized protein n=1 Tax=Sulfolobus turreted icosahedral virus 2 TaxID=754004 RepID=D5IEY4_9VIRU|nr:hypothetical protein STIV2_D87 [Sulfolobus turreted icosahedral virus 2]ADF27778.1 hypothetical protein STIV2_D87 [Sulfolobus turreted icosahedral virus 2]
MTIALSPLSNFISTLFFCNFVPHKVLIRAIVLSCPTAFTKYSSSVSIVVQNSSLSILSITTFAGKFFIMLRENAFTRYVLPILSPLF